MRKLLLPLFVILFSLIGCSSEEAEQPADNLDEALEDSPENPNGETSDFQALNMTFEFASVDGLEVTGDLKEVSATGPYAILCHQAGFSRGEYAETAAWFNKLGINTLAIDQRSGEAAREINNETAARAKAKALPQDYLSAEQDIRAAIDHIATLVAGDGRPLILVGSSYSASLVLKIAADTTFKHHDGIAGVISFSPGEYFKTMKLAPLLSTIECPVFITQAQNEYAASLEVSENIPDENLIIYQPDFPSIHGSRAIWKEVDGHEAVRRALKEFIVTLPLN